MYDKLYEEIILYAIAKMFYTFMGIMEMKFYRRVRKEVRFEFVNERND